MLNRTENHIFEKSVLLQQVPEVVCWTTWQTIAEVVHKQVGDITMLLMARKSYPTDLNDMEWEILAPLIPPAKQGGHPRTSAMQKIKFSINLSQK